jgi:urease accessory protein
MTMIMTTAIMANTATDSPAAPASTLLQLLWLASPALPVGGFSYSEGLESAVEAGLANTEALAGDWLLAQLHLGLARSELPALAQACGAWEAHDAQRASDINAWLRQTRESAEFRAQSEQMGRSLLDWLRNSSHAADPRLALLAALPGAPTWPVAVSLACVLAGASTRDALLTVAWAWAENMAQAAMKAVPLGQAAAQRMLSRLALEIPQAAQEALAMPDAGRQAHTPMLAILSAQHETQYSRLFRS